MSEQNVVERLRGQIETSERLATLAVQLPTEDARALLAVVEEAEELLDNIPPRYAYQGEIEAWEQAQDKAREALERLK